MRKHQNETLQFVSTRQINGIDLILFLSFRHPRFSSYSCFVRNHHLLRKCSNNVLDPKIKHTMDFAARELKEERKTRERERGRKSPKRQNEVKFTNEMEHNSNYRLFLCSDDGTNGDKNRNNGGVSVDKRHSTVNLHRQIISR